MQIISILAHLGDAGGKNDIWITAQKKSFVVDFSLEKLFRSAEFAQNTVLSLF